MSGRASRIARAAGARLDRARAMVSGEEVLAVPVYVEAIVVVALTVAALFLRAWNLSGSPVGIHGDETEMAMEALRSLRGESLSIWTGVTLGNPAGYSHWMAVIFRFNDADVATMRLASAIPGAAIVPVGYLLVRRLFSVRAALVTAALLTFSLWFIIQSRIAFAGITSVFMALLAMWLLVAAVQQRQSWTAVAAGVALGLGLYTFKTFLLYFVGIWGVALLAMAVSRELRWNRQVWLCLGVSALVGLPMLWFYATSGFIGPNLDNLYRVSLGDPSTWLRIPPLAADALLLVHTPVEGNTTDGPPAIPILPLLAALIFWVGLGGLLLFIRERRYQLLLGGWLVGMTPILLVPGVESRRYLLGMFFVLVIVAIGVDLLLLPAGRRVLRFLVEGRKPLPGGRRIAAAAVAALAVGFVAVFSAQNTAELQRWGNGESVRWFFNYEYHQSLVALKGLDLDAPIRYYTVRQSFNSSIRRFVLPDARGMDGAEEYGGSGIIPPPGRLKEDTVFVFLDRYLPLAATLEETYPDFRKVDEQTVNGRTLYVVYMVPAQPQAHAGKTAYPPGPIAASSKLK